MVVTPRFASTVILYRHNNAVPQDGFEIFLIQRARNMKFLGGYHAFPGGKLEEEDYSDRALKRCIGLDKTNAHQKIYDKLTHHQDEKYSLGFWVTGVRETFEETGLLYAYNQANELVDLRDPDLQRKYKEYREKLLNKEILFIDIMEKEDFYYAVDKIQYFRHFITPEFVPIRYDTRFFLAKMPPNQQLEPHTGEIISSEWGNPARFLKCYRKNEIQLIPPQYACLRSLRKVEDITQFCNSLK